MAGRSRKLAAEALWEYALRVLGAQARSMGELREKLTQRAQRVEDVPGILARLKQHGFLDDRRFAEGYAAARLENQGLGRERVLRDLRRRRVAPRLAEEAVRRAYQESDEAGLIEQYLRRKYRGVALEQQLAEPRRLAAVYRRLRGAGFSGAGILSVLKRLGAEADWLPAEEEAPDEPESAP